MFTTQTSLVAFVLAAVANGHMLMNTPTPYSTPALINSPLLADGSNFPCQLTSGESLVAGSASNTFALGSSQALKFTGQAVHGGGSCQISLTYDASPSASSTWKVIRSIEGGCPAEGQAGNMGDDASAADPYTYNFTVPSDIPTGSVTLAWTWFNKIGNREMYMNCAPVTLTGTGTGTGTGTSGSQSAYESLPDMFVANIGDGCATVDSTDLLFPNPGSDLVQLNGATSAFSTPTGTGCQVAGSSATIAATVAATVASAATVGVSAAAATAAAAAATSDVAGGVFITVPTTGAVAATTAAADTTSTAVVVATSSKTTTTTTPVAAAAATTTPAAAAAAATTAATSSSSSSSTSGTKETAGSACSPEGTWNCLGSSYQQCASGTWSVVMELAAGTSCTVGQGSTLSLAATNGKKKRVAMRFRA